MLKFIFVVCSLILVHSITIEGHGRKHGKFDPNVCCTVEASNSNETFAKMQELKQQCVTELFGDEPKGKHRGGFVCIAECMSKKVKVIDDNGNVNENEAKNFVKNEKATTDYQKEAADAAVTKCIEDLKKPSEDEPPAGKCSPTAIKFYFCIDRELFKACPKDKQDTSGKCVEMREHIESGKFEKHGPRHPPPSSEEGEDTEEAEN